MNFHARTTGVIGVAVVWDVETAELALGMGWGRMSAAGIRRGRDVGEVNESQLNSIA